MSKGLPCVATFLMALLLLGQAALAQETKPVGRGHRPDQISTFNVTVPAHEYDLLLIRPEKNAITLSVLAYQDAEGYVAYGTKSGIHSAQTPVQTLKKGTPAEIVLKDLQPDTAYCYQFRWRPLGSQTFANSPESTFHTARPAGATFTFTLTADAHLDEHTSAEVYLRTLANIRADQPDFHLDLGNLLMTDKHAQRDEAAAPYLAQRYYLGQIGPSVPILLALGTHDGEAARYDDGSPDALAPGPTRSADVTSPTRFRMTSTQAMPRPRPEPIRSKTTTPGSGETPCSSSWIPSATPCASAAEGTAGPGRWARRSTSG